MDTPIPASPREFDAPSESAVIEELDSAVMRLGQLDDVSVAEHVVVYEDIHGVLQDALTQIDADQK